MSVIAGSLGPGLPGYITAQSRQNANHPNGFVFKDCNVVGNGTAFLGRPWGGFARVLFYNSTLTNVVVPEGWNPWSFHESTMYELILYFVLGHLYELFFFNKFIYLFILLHRDLVFAEYGCRGEGANISGRAPWVKKMSKDEVRRLTSMSYIDEEGWMKNQPFNMLSS